MRSTFQRQQLRIGSLTRRAVRRDRALYGTVPTGRRDAGHEPGDEHKKHGWPRKLPPRPKPGVNVTLWSTALAARVRVRDAAAPGHRQAGQGHAAARAALTCGVRPSPLKIFAGEAR